MLASTAPRLALGDRDVRHLGPGFDLAEARPSMISHRRHRSAYARFIVRSRVTDYGVAVRPRRKLPELPGLDEVLREHVLYVLELCGGSGTKAAKILRIDRKTLYSMLRRWQAEQAKREPPR